LIRRRRRSLLLPYTTLFRSESLIGVAPVIISFRKVRLNCDCAVEILNRLPVSAKCLIGVPAVIIGLFMPRSDYDCPVKILNCLRSEEHTSELQSRENLVCRL